jgi:hypothetical protein
MCIYLPLLGKSSAKTLPRQPIHATIEELLDALFFIMCVSYQNKVGDWFFPELVLICENKPKTANKTNKVATRIMN